MSVRLKTNIKTPKGIQIIGKAEKQLLNECIRLITNTIELLMLKRDTCSNKVKEILLEKDDHNTLEDCNNLIERVKEYRHNSVMMRQKAKFEGLMQQKQNRVAAQTRGKSVVPRIEICLTMTQKIPRSGCETSPLYHYLKTKRGF